MNIRGEIYDYYYNKWLGFKSKGKSWSEINDSHSLYSRLDKFLELAYTLALRSRIAEVVHQEYTQLKTAEDITDIICPMNDSHILTVCCLDMGFDVSDKDIDRGVILDYSIYLPTLRELVKQEIQKVFDSIESHTLELIF